MVPWCRARVFAAASNMAICSWDTEGLALNRRVCAYDTVVLLYAVQLRLCHVRNS